MMPSRESPRSHATWAVALPIVALTALSAPAAAHDWYTGQMSPDGQGCCGGYDCAPVQYDGVSCDATGCDVTILPGTHPMLTEGDGPITFRYDGNPGLSPDGNAHACIAAEDVRRRRVRCLFIGGLM
jgi:hypothetical protein